MSTTHDQRAAAGASTRSVTPPFHTEISSLSHSAIVFPQFERRKDRKRERWWEVRWLVPGMFHDVLSSREGPRWGVFDSRRGSALLLQPAPGCCCQCVCFLRFQHILSRIQSLKEAKQHKNLVIDESQTRCFYCPISAEVRQEVSKSL